MKKKICKLSAAVLLFFSGIMEIGWRFFNMVVCCKRGGRKKERKKWFELSHIRDNHPRNGYAKEYDESRAWCETQKMQDCYIQSAIKNKYILENRTAVLFRQTLPGYKFPV